VTEFTVEVYGNAIKNESEWTQWRHATDVVPGTILLEDSGEPCLIFPIEATALNEAAIFAQGVMASLGLTIVWGRAYPAEDNAVKFRPFVPTCASRTQRNTVWRSLASGTKLA